MMTAEQRKAYTTHETCTSMGTSSYDEICDRCGASDGLGTWGNLVEPCPSETSEHKAKRLDTSGNGGGQSTRHNMTCCYCEDTGQINISKEMPPLPCPKCNRSAIDSCDYDSKNCHTRILCSILNVLGKAWRFLR